MPKILDDIENRILLTARNEILAHPDQPPSLRLIAQKTGIAVGTIYNYFPNKETLLVRVLIIDWQKSLKAMDQACAQAENLSGGIEAIYQAVNSFYLQFRNVFHTMPIGKGRSELTGRHIQFRHELQNRVDFLLDKFNLADRKKVSALYTEALIASVIHADLELTDLQILTNMLFEQKEE